MISRPIFYFETHKLSAGRFGALQKPSQLGFMRQEINIARFVESALLLEARN